MNIEQRLKALNITLPKVGSPLGNYVHAKRAGNLLYLSGKGPENADGTMPRGKLGAGVSIDEGYRHARQIGLVLIAAIKDALGGDLDGSSFVVHVSMETLPPRDIRHPRPLVHLGIAIDHLEAFFAQGITPKRHSLNLLRFVRLQSEFCLKPPEHYDPCDHRRQAGCLRVGQSKKGSGIDADELNQEARQP